MVSHRSLSDNKSPQVSRTLLSFLADLNNAVVWMVSTRPLISKSSNPCTNLLVSVLKPPTKISFIVTFMFHSTAFLIPKQGRGIYPSFHTLSISLCGRAGQQNLQFCKFFFFSVDHYKIWSSVRDLVIRLYIEIFCAPHSIEHFLGGAYITCSYDQTSASCTIPGGSLCPPIHVLSYILSALICCIRFSCLLFSLYHYITYICCFVASYLFSLLYGRSLWRCFVLLFEEMASSLPPSLLDTNSLSTSSLWCKALCLVISFLTLWSICLSSSLVHLVSYEGGSPRIYSFDKVPAIEFCLE